MEKDEAREREAGREWALKAIADAPKGRGIALTSGAWEEFRGHLAAAVLPLIRERNEALRKLADAAMEINCAGPVDHRIRVLRREQAERLDAAVLLGEKLAAALQALDAEIAETTKNVQLKTVGRMGVVRSTNVRYWMRSLFRRTRESKTALSEWQAYRRTAQPADKEASRG